MDLALLTLVILLYSSLVFYAARATIVNAFALAFSANTTALSMFGPC